MSEKVESFTAKLPPAVRQPVEKALSLAKALPRSARIFALTTTVALIVLGTYFGIRSSNPPYTTLFTNLDRDDAATVVAKLKEMKVPYRLEGDGAVIEVPEEKARDLRLELAGAGLPRGGAIGFESFDKMKLGATEFEQRIQYRRALEGELSRTIGSVSAVQSARVHLVLPERSVFVSKNEPSTASVILKLRGGRALGQGEVAGIAHLVASSVSGLTPEHVSIVTTEGTVLHKPKRNGESGEGDDDRATQARALEATLEERARAMVEKVTGAGHVDVRVSADVDTSRVERVEDHYDPKQTVLRSEERSVERTGAEEIPLAGVPGAESNLPGGATAKAMAASADGGAPAPSASTTTASNAGTSRESHTRNFEVDHVTEKRVITGGVLRRITVAVVLDGIPVSATNPTGTRSKEEMDKITSLVRSAVGFDGQRGDAVTVESVPFLVEPPPPPPEPMFPKLPWEMKKVVPVAAGVSALFILLTILKIRSMLKKGAAKRAKVTETALALAAANAKEKQAAQQVTIEIMGPDGAKPLESSDDLRRLVRERAQLDPATAALVVRGWLGSATDRAPVHEDAAA